MTNLRINLSIFRVTQNHPFQNKFIVILFHKSMRVFSWRAGAEIGVALKGPLAGVVHIVQPSVNYYLVIVSYIVQSLALFNLGVIHAQHHYPASIFSVGGLYCHLFHQFISFLTTYNIYIYYLFKTNIL